MFRLIKRVNITQKRKYLRLLVGAGLCSIDIDGIVQTLIITGTVLVVTPPILCAGVITTERLICREDIDDESMRNVIHNGIKTGLKIGFFGGSIPLALLLFQGPPLCVTYGVILVLYLSIKDNSDQS